MRVKTKGVFYIVTVVFVSVLILIISIFYHGEARLGLALFGIFFLLWSLLQKTILQIEVHDSIMDIKYMRFFRIRNLRLSIPIKSDFLRIKKEVSFRGGVDYKVTIMEDYKSTISVYKSLFKKESDFDLFLLFLRDEPNSMNNSR